MNKKRKRIKGVKYYYVSYFYCPKLSDCGTWGMGCSYFSTGMFDIVKARNQIMKSNSFEGVVILNFIRITKRQFEGGISGGKTKNKGG